MERTEHIGNTVRRQWKLLLLAAIAVAIASTLVAMPLAMAGSLADEAEEAADAHGMLTSATGGTAEVEAADEETPAMKDAPPAAYSDGVGGVSALGAPLAPTSVSFATLTYGSDPNGSISEWMLKGDANRDGSITSDDIQVISDHVNGVSLLSGLAYESADIDSIQGVRVADYATISRLEWGTASIPDTMFTFRVVDTPAAGFRVSGVTVDGASLAVPTKGSSETTGGYTVSVAADGIATITGQSLATNNVQVVHALDAPFATLTYGSDSNGSINEWMLKGDANRDGMVTADDAQDILAHINFLTELSGLAYESADIDSTARITAADYGMILRLQTGTSSIPYSPFTFRVVDAPEAGYHVSAVTVNGAPLVVPAKGASVTTGDYSVSVDANGMATITGLSQATNDVQVAHVRAPIVPPGEDVVDTGGDNGGGTAPTDNGGGAGGTTYNGVVLITPQIAQTGPAGQTPQANTNPIAQALIGDDGTPLGFMQNECWIHWLMIPGLLASFVYAIAVMLRRSRFTSYLRGLEESALGYRTPKNSSIGTEGLAHQA